MDILTKLEKNCRKLDVTFTMENSTDIHMYTCIYTYVCMYTNVYLTYVYLTKIIPIMTAGEAQYIIMPIIDYTPFGGN